MIYDYEKHRQNELHGWALIELVGRLTDKQFREIDPTKLDVVLQINGQEINFLSFVDQFYAQIDHIAHEQANDILKAVVGNSMDTLYQIEELLKDRLTTFLSQSERETVSRCPDATTS